MAGDKDDWRAQCKGLNEAWSVARQRSILTDVKFVVGPSATEISAHKLFLALCSPVFEAMFYGLMPEKDSVIIPDVEESVFLHIVRSSYDLEIKFSTPVEATKTYLAADKYMMYHLKRIAERHIQEAYMNANFIWKALSLDDNILYVPVFWKRCMDYFAEDASYLVTDVRFLNLPLCIVMKILELENLNIKEITLMQKVSEWACVNCKENLVEMMKMFSKLFLYHKLNLSEFFDFIGEHPYAIDAGDSLAIAKHLHTAGNFELPGWYEENPRIGKRNRKGKSLKSSKR